TLTIDTSVVPLLATSNSFGGAITAPSFAGNGAGLTNVNAAALGGFSPSTFATIGPNAFTGNQTITGGSVGIGTTTPQAALDVTGAVNATTSFNLSSSPFVSGSPSPEVANTSVGFLALSNSGSNNTGVFDTAVGFQALNLNTSGGQNTAVGFQSLASNTSGSENTALGEGA